jgi:hypothetical protein
MILLKPGAEPDMGARVASVIDKIRRFDEDFCTQTFLTELSGVVPDPTQVWIFSFSINQAPQKADRLDVLLFFCCSRLK